MLTTYPFCILAVPSMKRFQAVEPSSQFRIMPNEKELPILDGIKRLWLTHIFQKRMKRRDAVLILSSSQGLGLAAFTQGRLNPY